MRARRTAIAAATLAIAACADLTPPPPEEEGANMNRYVAMGSSITMGVESDGVVESSQRSSWPALLAASASVEFGVPAIASPGCRPPLVAPLANFRRADNSLVTDPGTCAPNVAGFTLPEQNVAIAGATAALAVSATPTGNSNPLYSRVLAEQQNQLSAMRAMTPSFVSVEFGSMEILPAMAGVVGAIEPFATFTASYASIIGVINQLSAQALLVRLPADPRKFPSVRTAAEIASQSAAFAARNITVNADCATSGTYISVQWKVFPAIVTAAARASAGLGPLAFSCADVPNTADGVLTEADMTTLTTRIGQINTFLTNRATANGFATFSLGVLYDTAKDGVPFDLNALLTSSTPFGALISLDGLHPTAAGQAVLANAARAAIIQTYGSITR